jgi:nickel/cobalt transporter (NicO) family protein
VTVSSFGMHYMPNLERVRLIALIAVVLVLFGAASADAHPLGNFSVNHLSTVSISSDRVEVRYVLDQAEIPTVQERGLGRAEVLRRKLAEVRDGLTLTVDGRRLVLRPAGEPKLSFPSGAGGLATTRLELTLDAAVESPGRASLRDGTFPGRVGWKTIVAAPGERTAVRTETPSGDPTAGLRRYPEDLLESPLDRRDATFSVTPGDGTLIAPRAEGGRPVATTAPAAPGSGGREAATAGPAAGSGGPATTPDGRAADSGEPRADGFAALFEDAAAGQGVLALLLLAAFGWGALHALSPGHGKAMVAAYLIGTHGTARDALVLGATVTITHTIGVFALGLVTLALSQYVLPEQLYPWLALASGLLVVAVGAGVLRSRLRGRRGHGHGHAHPHAHEHSHSHEPAPLGRRGLLGMGAAAGLLPCPSALVVLLGAVSQHEVALGMLLIVAFSLGLAGTLTALGVAVVHARRFVPPRIAASRLAALLPAVSAVLVMTLGFVLAAGAVPDVV